MPANSARVVYGTIVVATLLAAESPQKETCLKTGGRSCDRDQAGPSLKPTPISR